MTPPRRILSIVFTGALLATGLIAGPSNAAETSAAPTASKAAVGTTQSLTVKRRHKITITLKTAADGGYGWVITQGRNSPKFEVLSKKVVSKPGQVGGFAKTIYVLRTTALGNATFKVVERRPFDKSDVIDKFTLKLHVTETGR